MLYPKVAFVIVNYNGKKFLRLCLSSINRLNYPVKNISIIMVDNGSDDDSVNFVKKEYKRVKIYRLNKNYGFAKANNLGIKKVLNDRSIKYVITLNNDTKLDPNWLKYLVGFLNQNKSTGIVVGKMLRLNNKKRFDSTGDFFDSKTLRVLNRGFNKIDRGQFDKIEECFSACAAGAVYRREVLEQVEYKGEFFDEDFMSYIEDIDLNTRARLLGWKIYYIPKAILFHKGSATSNIFKFKYKEYFSRKNRILYAIKNYPLKPMITLTAKYIFPTKKGINYYKGPQKVRKKGIKHYTGKGINFYFNLIIERFFRGISQASLAEIVIIQIHAIISSIILLPKMIKKRNIIKEKIKIDPKTIFSWFNKYSI